MARFAVPAGMLTGVGVVASYLFVLHDVGLSVPEARTVATAILVLVGLYLVSVLEATGGRRTRAVLAGCCGLAGAFVAAAAFPAAREFFALSTVTPTMLAATAVGTLLACLLLALSGLRPGNG